MVGQSKESEGASSYVHLISVFHSVTVNNGSSGLALGESSILPTAAGHVVVTPLTSRPGPATVNTPVHPQLISMVLVKAFVKGSKKSKDIHPKKYQS